MALPPNFPTDPHAILAPEQRGYPGEDVLAEAADERLLPPRVHKVRQKKWETLPPRAFAELKTGFSE